METLQASQGYYDAIRANDRSLNFSIARWESWIEASFNDFAGNVKNAAVLLYETTQGMKWLRGELQSDGLRGFCMPKLVILIFNQGLYPAGQTPGTVYLNQNFLEQYSLLSMNGSYDITRTDGEIHFVGKLSDYFGLIGVEECHHDIFAQFNSARNGVDPLTMTLAEYDARDNEYEALRYQVRYAWYLNMDQMTILTLQDRFQKASQVRQRQHKT